MKKLKCYFWGHKPAKEKYGEFHFSDGKVSYGTVCTRCDKLLFCLEGTIKGSWGEDDNKTLAITELSDQSEKARQELFSNEKS